MRQGAPRADAVHAGQFRQAADTCQDRGVGCAAEEPAAGEKPIAGSKGGPQRRDFTGRWASGGPCRRVPLGWAGVQGFVTVTVKVRLSVRWPSLTIRVM